MMLAGFASSCTAATSVVSKDANDTVTTTTSVFPQTRGEARKPYRLSRQQGVSANLSLSSNLKMCTNEAWCTLACPMLDHNTCAAACNISKRNTILPCNPYDVENLLPAFLHTTGGCSLEKRCTRCMGFAVHATLMWSAWPMLWLARLDVCCL